MTKQKNPQLISYFLVGIACFLLGLAVGSISFAQPKNQDDLELSSPQIGIAPPASNSTQELSGQVIYREFMALPEGSRISIELQDVSRADAPTTILASQEIITAGENVPIPFTLTYNPDDIVENRTYGILAKIYFEDQLMWISNSANLVLTQGNPTNDVEIWLVRAQ